MVASPSFAAMTHNEISIRRDGQLARLQLGIPGRDALTLRKGSGQEYTANFLKAVQERGDEIEAQLSEKQLLDRFVAFRGRDVVPPKAKAEAKKQIQKQKQSDR